MAVTYKSDLRIMYGAGGRVLDRDPLIAAHREEMILPTRLSNGLQRMIDETPADKRFRYKP